MTITTNAYWYRHSTQTHNITATAATSRHKANTSFALHKMLCENSIQLFFFLIVVRIEKKEEIATGLGWIVGYYKTW